jgi:hypothetical protein
MENQELSTAVKRKSSAQLKAEVKFREKQKWGSISRGSLMAF